jgi:hypothetical protein
MYFDTVEEYTAEIAMVRQSIHRTLESQKYGRSGAGTASESQRVDLSVLRDYLQELIGERDLLQASSDVPTRIYAKAGRRF